MFEDGPYAKHLDYIVKDNFDDMSDIKDKLKGYDAFLCTLGSRVNKGDEFIKVDYDYPL